MITGVSAYAKDAEVSALIISFFGNFSILLTSGFVQGTSTHCSFPGQSCQEALAPLTQKWLHVDWLQAAAPVFSHIHGMPIPAFSSWSFSIKSSRLLSGSGPLHLTNHCKKSPELLNVAYPRLYHHPSPHPCFGHASSPFSQKTFFVVWTIIAWENWGLLAPSPDLAVLGQGYTCWPPPDHLNSPPKPYKPAIPTPVRESLGRWETVNFYLPC